MKHEDVWRALDTLAAEKGLSPSGLARAAGLDPTTFNRSKRSTRAGLRWPSTESLSRVLHATGASLEAFTALVGGTRVLASTRHHRGGGQRQLPVLPMSRLGEAELFDRAGHPRRENWEQIEIPQPGDPHDYAVRVDSAHFEPAFREGGILLVSPDTLLRPGDRALLHEEPAGPVSIVRVLAANGGRFRFQSFAGSEPLSMDRTAACRMHRIVWTAC